VTAKAFKGGSVTMQSMSSLCRYATAPSC